MEWWLSEIHLFMIQNTLMFAWFCVSMGVASQWLYERLIEEDSK